jgi:hypothetical protein
MAFDPWFYVGLVLIVAYGVGLGQLLLWSRDR